MGGWGVSPCLGGQAAAGQGPGDDAAANIKCWYLCGHEENMTVNCSYCTSFAERKIYHKS